MLADRVGVDFFGVGEHHRDDFAVSAPEVVLAAIAARTERIQLGSAVTVLSSDDPMRVYERFATLDAISNGRAEVILGRGSFTESFPLFGYDLGDYEKLFEEKLDLFAALHDGAAGHVAGDHARAARRPATSFPKTESGSLTTWVGVGGSPESVVRAARYGFALMLAIIGGEPARFAPFVDLYHRALAEFGRPSCRSACTRPATSPTPTSRRARSCWPHFKSMRDRDRRASAAGRRPRASSSTHEAGPTAPLYVGSPETVAREDRRDRADARASSRFDLKYANGALPHDQLMHAIELYGTEVIPRVRELLD